MNKIVFPKCIYCGTEQCTECPVCGVLSCWDCMKVIDEDICVHAKYEQLQSVIWNEEVE